MKKIVYLFLLVQLLLGGSAWAQHAFVVKRIEFQGLQRVSPETAERYLPIKRGQTLQPAKTGEIVRALYKTGFFDHISLTESNDTLIIHVTERPTIGQLKISGNSVIPTDKLTNVMKTLDVAEGRAYNPSVLAKIKQSLLNQYYQLGRYNARVDISVTPMTRNRVLVKIDISEGLVAKIHRISIIGNHVFDESTLIKNMDISTSGLFTFITQSDRYSEEKLEASIEKLRGYYLDRGYVRFEVKSAQAQVTPDRKSVYITIVVSEGQLYTIEDYHLNGNLLMPNEEVEKLLKIKRGQVFSRQKILDSEKAITTAYGEKGYMFTTIGLRPEVNDNTHTVSLNFEIKPGKRTYVRQVTFSENNRTNDVVLRREVQQLEAAPASTTRLDESKRRLLLLPYIKEAEMSIKPVEGVDDQVDVNYKVKENNSAQASVKLGYSQIYGIIFGAGLNQNNFMGTGNTFGINLQRSKYEQVYGIDYTNPYYTEDGISRSISFAISRVDPGSVTDAGYTSNEFSLGLLYGIPVGQEQGVINRVQAGVNYQNILIHTIHGKVSRQVNTFITRHGRHFQEADFRLGYFRDSRDKALFTTRGALQSWFVDAYAPLASKSLSFYTLNYAGRWYQPLTEQFILMSKANLAYGNGFYGINDYPFFKNFYAGGIDTVRAYRGFTLGPRDSNFRPYGGNMLANGSVGLVFPNYISDNLRTSIFVDAGNVYSSINNRSYGGQSTNSGPIRYSAGVDVLWLSPFGPVEVSVSQPVYRRPHDDLEPFQLSLGANF
jgi:outer membrane protein insertion porin family